MVAVYSSSIKGRYTLDKNGLTVYADQHYSAGDQIYISYGVLTNPQLLNIYGFILPDNIYETMQFQVK
jgi:hypothetical protein